ncbi:hypothetical protein AGMMS49574_05550 [Bacteroidia bacterium]|nr:hypothetical protein AGMMS49574_05550 [Bacteroidia bacterium]
MQLKQGTSLQGNKNLYRIEGVLGQGGGFGITYLATMSVQVEGSLGKINTKVKVAIKEFFMKDLCNRSESTSHVSVPSEGSKDLVERYKQKFIKEAKSISRLQHPHIIKVVEVFEGNGTAYYVMEYIEGSSLQELARQRGALPEQEALRYIVQIASALDYIHSRQLNHLNVKPGNIICQPDGEVVLIDFGLSKQYDERGEETSSTPLGISAGYSPIEQYEGVSQFSAPTDIYALGATLYKLITGQNPPVASDVMNAGLPPLPAGISADTVQAIQKAMEPGRRNRLQTIKEFLALLADVEVSVPLLFLPPTLRFKKFLALLADVEETKRIPPSGSAPRPIPPIPPKPKPKQFPWKPIVAIASIAAAAFLLFFLLGENSSGIKGSEAAIEMVYVQGGTFSMGCSGEQGGDCHGSEKPLHSVTVSSFNIGKYEVTQAQWKQIMGSNPSYFKGDNLPVESVSWEDVQEFISKLNAATGKRYRLPTEAEWEYAARGGNRSQGYKYSGSNNLNNVAWYVGNSSSKTHPVGAKSPNELGVYDMSGNVWEWCSDWYDNYNSSSQTNPTGPSTGSYRVLRGGSWYDFAKYCRVSYRDGSTPGDRGRSVGFRLVLVTITEIQKPVDNPSRQIQDSRQSAKTKSAPVEQTKPAPVEQATPSPAIEMVYVQGGTFSMGCSGEQGSDCGDDEKPLHSVTVSNFNIGKYEVTQAQWKQIMGSIPSYFKDDNLPVENVSWEDVQEFISKLNAATGKRYRLPTEAEWEYAARGGNRSQGYKYSGSNNLNNVAWYWDNSSNKTHPVGAKSPNELGVYDMSGNVWEWCSDRYGDYNSSSQTNPTGPSTGSYRVLRGGSWSGRAEGCRVSLRDYNAPGIRYYNVGFRLVLPL